MKKTIGYVLSHTHWDREWYLSFQLFRMRLVDMLDTLIPYLEQHPEFPHFHLDGQTVCLEDYLEVRPEQAERLAACAPEGKVPVTKEQREEAMRQGDEALREQFAAVREAYPGAQLHEELESPVFMRLVMRGVDARNAYELTHLRELRAGAMAYGARRAREELTAAMQAGYLRPRESGMAPAAGGAFAESPEHWSRQTREELKARARRGETVRL